MSDVTCGVFAEDFLIGYANVAWFEFGRANGARRLWGLDDRLLDAISEPLRSYYAEKLAQVLVDGQPWEHDYECSSVALHREFRLRVLMIADGEGLLLTHTLRFERPHVDGLPLVTNRYQAATGLITQCAHCRRVRRVAAPHSWDWVPALVEKPSSNISHGLCGLCSAYYFGPNA